jgi:copper(I)-binding protein
MHAAYRARLGDAARRMHCVPSNVERPAMTLRRRAVVLHAGLLLCTGAFATCARACEFCASTLKIIHPWTRATAPGERMAKLCMSFDEVTEPDRLIGVRTPMAGRVELAGTKSRRVDLAIPAGRTTVLTEAGVHLRLLDLTQPLEVGRAYPLTLEFARGGEVIAGFEVDYEHDA